MYMLKFFLLTLTFQQFKLNKSINPELKSAEGHYDQRRDEIFQVATSHNLISLLKRYIIQEK